MKAQVTIFIIIGLFLLITVGITIYVTNMIISKPKIVKIDVNDFVVDCLKQSSESSFKEIALGGGYLRKENNEVIIFNKKNYSVLINKPKNDICSGDVCLFYALPWKYPWISFPFGEDGLEKSFLGYFGDSYLPSMNVIKTKLEADIEDKFLFCIDDFNAFKKQDITIKKQLPPEVNIIFYNLSFLADEELSQDRFTTIELKWPLVEYSDISVTGENIFSVKLPLRFSTVYYFVESMINKDISNVSYVPEAENLLVNVIPFDGFSLVNLTDPLSNIFGEKFNFVFARENRYPALWKVELPRTVFHVSEDGRPTKLIIEDNILTIEDPCDDLIRIILNGSDADENPLIFSTIPEELDLGDRNFSIVVSDGKREDYQEFEVNVILCTL